MRIVILEDNADRQHAMKAVLKKDFPDCVPEFFEAVTPMINRLIATGFDNVSLISLDHDLEMIPGEDHQLHDPGTGVDAAKWLASQPPIAPLIIHTTNRIGGDQMEQLLRPQGWTGDRIVPYGGEDWINEIWRSTVKCLVAPKLPAPKGQ